MNNKFNRIGFSNFKSFGPKMQKFSKKPIILVYGANSVGKSSVLHSMLYLKHNLSFPGFDFKKSTFAGDELDLGGFENIVFKKNKEESIHYQFTFSDPETIDEKIFSSKKVGKLLGIEIETLEINIDVDCENNFSIECIINSTEKVLSAHVTTWKITVKNKIDILDDINSKKLLIVILESIGFGRKYQYIAPLRLFPKRRDMNFPIWRYWYINLSERFNKSINKIGPNNIYQFEMEKFMMQDAMKNTTYKKAYENVKEKHGKIMAILYANLLYPLLHLLLTPIIYILPIFMQYVKYYMSRFKLISIFTFGFDISDSMNHGGRNGKNMWRDFFNNEKLRSKISKWLENPDKLKSSYGLKREGKKLFFVDNRTNTHVLPKDMGLGISQVLPILYSCFDAKDTEIYIEQPEIHLHPAVQSELADEFIRSYNERDNEFFIETHSEHLLLRIMRRMRETNDDLQKDENLRITPDNICLLYVDNHKGKTFIRELKLDNDGSLLSRWPNGFFEESYNEMFYKELEEEIS